jgi:hypothetical protein
MIEKIRKILMRALRITVLTAVVVSLKLYIVNRDKRFHEEADKINSNTNITISEKQKKEITVFVTETGGRYHLENCGYLRYSKIPVPLEQAKEEYLPCSVCRPTD